ncbi:hypothetical protein FACS1894166_09660 [Bacilli bacterium]|nr:hypothetical protein FACS1894166_09660 [Bacilli bacterium]
MSKSNVDMIKIKMNDWVNEITHEHNPANSFIKESRKKTQAMFTALLSSGARLNELQIN